MILASHLATPRTIQKLTLDRANAHSDGDALADVSKGFEALEAKQNKLDQDMEMLHENLMLQASVAEKDEQIAALKAELAKLGRK